LLQPLVLLDQIFIIFDDQIQKFIHFIDIVSANGVLEILVENIHRREPLHVDPSPNASATHSLLYYDTSPFAYRWSIKEAAQKRERGGFTSSSRQKGPGRNSPGAVSPRGERFGAPCP